MTHPESSAVDVVLVVPPFADVERPALGPSLLAAALYAWFANRGARDASHDVDAPKSTLTTGQWFRPEGAGLLEARAGAPGAREVITAWPSVPDPSPLRA
jgi:hypothetical protein